MIMLKVRCPDAPPAVGSVTITLPTVGPGVVLAGTPVCADCGKDMEIVGREVV